MGKLGSVKFYKMQEILEQKEEMKEFTDVLWGFVAVWGEISYNTC